MMPIAMPPNTAPAMAPDGAPRGTITRKETQSQMKDYTKPCGYTGDKNAGNYKFYNFFFCVHTGTPGSRSCSDLVYAWTDSVCIYQLVI